MNKIKNVFMFCNDNENKIVLWFIIFIFIAIIIFMYFKSYKKQKEPFMGKVNRAVREINNVGREMKRIPNQISGVGRKIGSVGQKIGKVGGKISREIDTKFAKFFKKIEKETKKLVIDKIAKFFVRLIKVLKEALVDPIIFLVETFGFMFLQIFKILKMIVDKIVSLPNCMPFYIISGTYYSVRAFFKKFIPGFIWNFFRDIFKFIGKFTRPWINWLISYNWIKEKCYDFNVNSKIKKINRRFKEAGHKFKSGFGKFRSL